MKDLIDLYDDKETTEICGFLLDDGTIVQLQNVHPEPSEGFEIDPSEVLAYEDKLTAIWHTHPNKEAVLSGDDKLCMEQWPDLTHYIIGSDGVRKYIVTDGVVMNADYLPR